MASKKFKVFNLVISGAAGVPSFTHAMYHDTDEQALSYAKQIIVQLVRHGGPFSQFVVWQDERKVAELVLKTLTTGDISVVA